jgi:hypothetical protein
MLKGREAYARYDPFRIMVDMGRRGPWQTQERDALGGVEVQERRGPAVLKKDGGGFQEPKTRWSRDSPRTDGGEASHRFPRFSGRKDSEAHENHGGGE